MNFRVRSAREKDFEDILSLARQFTLLNLPADPKVIKDKIQVSRDSFSGKKEREEAEYLFVLEDLEVDRVIGTCLILAKHGTETSPHYFFKIIEKKHQSDSLGVGFIHSALRFGEDPSGPTEIGGLLLDRGYRRRPEKLGQFMGMSRFVYMSLFPDKFQEEVLCELTPPLTDEGRSEFWEALGRRFTGMSYKEADRLSQKHKGFIKTLFPKEDIYLCLLDSQARLVTGEVADDTKGAKHVLEKVGFRYRREVDPFDGGPHYGAKTSEISVVKNSRLCRLERGSEEMSQKALLGINVDDEFHCFQRNVLFHSNGEVHVNFYEEDPLLAHKGSQLMCVPI